MSNLRGLAVKDTVPFSYSHALIERGYLIDVLHIADREGRVTSVEFEHCERGHSVAEKLRQLAEHIDTAVKARWVDRKLPDGSVVRVDTHWICALSVPLEVCEPTQDFGITEQL